MRLACISYSKNAFGWIYDAAKPFGGLPRPQKPHAMTLMWSAYTDAHTDAFGTHWFWARQNGTFESQNYFGTANRNDAGTWRFSISCHGTDFFNSDAIVLGRWYRQALRRRELASSTEYDYFYDLPDTSKVITAVTGPGDVLTVGANHQLRFGDVTWNNFEGLDGRLDQIKIWEDFLDTQSIVAESRHTWPLEGRYLPRLWACVPDIRRGYMRDVSGRGNHAKIIADTESPSRLTDIEPPYRISKYRPQYSSFRGLSVAVTIKTVADTGTGADALAALAAALAVTDTGAGADAGPAVAVLIAVADAVAGSDSVSAAVSITLTDVMVGSESVSIAVGLTLSDAASGVDLVTVLQDILISVADAAAGSDNISALAAALAVSDSATGADSTGIGVSFSVTESATGTDQGVFSIALTIGDLATAADIITLLQDNLISVLDSGTGIEQVSVSVQLPIADAAIGSESLNPQALLTILDSLTGTDAVVTFNSITRIASITFALAPRSMTFLLEPAV